MRTQITKFWKTLSTQQAIVIVGLIAVAGWLASRWPVEFWTKLAEQDPTEVGLRVGLCLLAVYGVFAKAKSA